MKLETLEAGRNAKCIWAVFEDFLVLCKENKTEFPYNSSILLPGSFPGERRIAIK